MSGIFLGGTPQFFDDSGDPVALGIITFYEPGTLTKKTIYTSASLGTPASNPQTLSAGGRLTVVYGTGAYKAILLNAALVQVGATMDPVYLAGNIVHEINARIQSVLKDATERWTIGRMPLDALITRVSVIPDKALTGDNTDYVTLSLRWYESGALQAGAIATKAFTSGVNLAAYTETALTIDTSKDDMEAGDVLMFEKTDTGLGEVLPALNVHVEYLEA